MDLTIISNFASVKLVMQLDKIFLEPEMHSYENENQYRSKRDYYKKT
jgi:hypothetical protein